MEKGVGIIAVAIIFFIYFKNKKKGDKWWEHLIKENTMLSGEQKI